MHGGHLLPEVQGDVAQPLLDVIHDFPLGHEGEVMLCQDLHQSVRSSQPGPDVQWHEGEHSPCGWHSAGDPFDRVHHDASGLAWPRRLGTWLGCSLCYLFTLGLRAQRGLSEQHRVLLTGHKHAVCCRCGSRFSPCHPVGDNAMLDGYSRVSISLLLCSLWPT